MKLLTSLLAISGLAATCTAHGRLFVASDSGNITTLDIVHGFYGTTLAVLATSSGCGSTPSWLELDSKTSTLYCINEGNGENASISSFRVEENGSLVLNSMLVTHIGGVNSAIYGNGNAIAIAHFNDMLTTVSLAKSNELTIINTFNLTTNFLTPAYPHQVLLDPSDNYLFVPAYGTDQVHWFEIDQVNYNLTHKGHLTLDAGSKPRHGVFYTPPGSDGSIAYYYVVTEGTNKIHGFEISYDAQKKISGTKSVYNETTFADAVPANVFASEVVISPDNKFLLVSSRNDSRTTTTPIDPTTNTTLPSTESDTIISFALSPTNGTLSVVFTGRRQAGGHWPRHFSLNSAGDMVAVGLQKDHKVAIINRNIATGLMENSVVNEIVLDGNINAVIWDEEEEEDEVVGGTGPVQNGTYTFSGYVGGIRPTTTLVTSTIAATSTPAMASLTSGVTQATSLTLSYIPTSTIATASLPLTGAAGPLVGLSSVHSYSSTGTAATVVYSPPTSAATSTVEALTIMVLPVAATTLASTASLPALTTAPTLTTVPTLSTVYMAATTTVPAITPVAESMVMGTHYAAGNMEDEVKPMWTVYGGRDFF